MALDVADPEALTAFARRVVTEHPGLIVLINNAGIMTYEDLSGSRDLREAEETIAGGAN